MNKLKIVLMMGLIIILCGMYVYGAEEIKKDELYVTGIKALYGEESVILNGIIKVDIKKDNDNNVLFPLDVEVLDKNLDQNIKDAVFNGLISDKKGIVSYQIGNIEKKELIKAEVIFNKGILVKCILVDEEGKNIWLMWPEGVEIANFGLKKMIEKNILKKYETDYKK